MERCEIYGLRVELSWPARQWAQGDEPVEMVIFLGGEHAFTSVGFSPLRWLLAAAQALLPKWRGGADGASGGDCGAAAASAPPTARAMAPDDAADAMTEEKDAGEQLMTFMPINRIAHGPAGSSTPQQHDASVVIQGQALVVQLHPMAEVIKI